MTFDAISDFVSVLDSDFRIVKVNRALAAFLGKNPEEIIGKHCYELMHGRTSRWDGCPHEQMMQEKKSVTRIVDDPHIGIPLLITASPILNAAGRLVGSVHVARDVSMVTKIQNDIALRNQQLEAVNQLIRRAIASRSPKDVVEIVIDIVVRIFSPDIALYYAVSGEWLMLQGANPADEEFLNKKEKVGECLCGTAAKEGVPLFSENIHCDARCTLTECKEAGIQSFAALPVKIDGIVTGVIGLASKTQTTFADQQEFLETLAYTVGLVSQNARLIEELRRNSEMLEQKVSERTRDLGEKNQELERFNKLFVDREFRIKELKEQMRVLEAENEKKKI